MGCPVVHFEIHGKDRAKSSAFYETLFGWKVDANNPMDYGMVDTGAEGAGIAGAVCASEMAPNVVIYVQVDDPQAYLDKAEAKGAKTLMPVTEIPNVVTFAIFRDPDGNAVGLVKDTS